MKIKPMFFSLLLVCLSFLPIFSASAETVELFGGAYQVSYDGRSYDSNSDRTSFSYTVTAVSGGSGLGFGHITFEVPLCDPNLSIDASLTTPGYSFGLDVTTQVNGIKWSGVSIEVGESATFTMAFIGDVFTNAIDFSIKTGVCNSNPNTNHPDCEIASISGPGCNPALTCSLPEIVSVECGSGQGVANLNYEIFGYDNNLGYSWETDCLEAEFGTLDAAAPSSGSVPVTLATMNELDEPVSCSITLKLESESEQTSCSTSIQVESCEVDCLGNLIVEDQTPATFDDCNVCNGNNQDKDACGVCFGDGSSCIGGEGEQNDPVCSKTNNFPQQLVMDGAAANLKGLVKNVAAKIARTLGKENRFSKQLLADANALYLAAWNFTWVVPTEATSCTGVSCYTVDSSAAVADYLDKVAQLEALVVKGVARWRKLARNNKLGQRLIEAASSQRLLGVKTSEGVQSSSKFCS